MATQIDRNTPSTASPRARKDDQQASEQERERRRWLAITDQLLNEIEELNLREHRKLPNGLASRILAAHSNIAGTRREPTLTSLTRAHDAVLCLQSPLLAGNPRWPRPSTFPRRGAGQPSRVPTGNAVSWKALALPPVPEDGVDDAWLELALLTVERAFDRWAWAHHHAVTAATRRVGARAAAGRLVAAWTNYQALADELDRIRTMSSRVT